MANGKIPGVRQASAKEIRELLKVAVRDEELSNRDTDARVLPDGRVLLYLGEGEKGALYPSREALKEMNRRCEETKRKTIEQFRTGFRDPGMTLLPPIADFIRDVETHAKSLGPRLHIADEALDGTLA